MRSWSIRRAVAPVVCVSLAAISSAAQAPARKETSASAAAQAIEKTLFRLEDEFAQAVVRRDPKALGRIVAPKWVYSDESGVMQRAEGIKAFTSGTDTVQQASNADMRALIYSNAAVVIGILQMQGRGPGGPFTRRYRYTDTWVMLDGRWQCVASQDYLMPEKKR